MFGFAQIMSFVFLIIMTVACSGTPPPAPSPTPAACYLLDDQGGYLLSDTGEKLLCQ